MHRAMLPMSDGNIKSTHCFPNIDINCYYCFIHRSLRVQTQMGVKATQNLTLCEQLHTSDRMLFKSVLFKVVPWQQI